MAPEQQGLTVQSWFFFSHLFLCGRTSSLFPWYLVLGCSLSQQCFIEAVRIAAEIHLALHLKFRLFFLLLTVLLNPTNQS